LWPKIAVACVLLAGLWACYALLFDHTTVIDLQPDHVTVTELQPARVQVGGHGDLVIHIGVHWPKDGWCSGQFTVTATETATQVRVDNVISREYGNVPCAGLGTVDQTVWVGSPSPHRSVTGKWYEPATARASRTALSPDQQVGNERSATLTLTGRRGALLVSPAGSCRRYVGLTAHQASRRRTALDP
jgi:hypothetical protein